MTQPRFRWWWCDGFFPDEHGLAAGSIRGRCWIVQDNGLNSAWKFALLPGRSIQRDEHRDWGAMCPTENKEGWIDLDFERESATSELSRP